MRRGSALVVVLALVSGCACGARVAPPLSAVASSVPQGPRTLWSWAVATDAWDVPAALVAMPDGGLVVLAWSWAPTEADRGTNPPRMPRAATLVLVRLDDAGTVLWTRRFGGQAGDLAFGLAADADQIVVAGETRGLALDGLPPLAATGSDGFVAWFDARGVPTRRVGIGGAGNERLFALSRANDGSLVAVGLTASADVPPGHSLRGAMDALVVAFGADGQIAWQSAIDGDGAEIATGAAEPYVAGISASPTFGTGERSATGHGRFDTWVGRLDPRGDLLDVWALGGTGDDYAYDLQSDLEGGVLLGGVTQRDDLLARGLWQSQIVRVGPDGASTTLWSACCVHYDYGVSVAPGAGRLLLASSFDGPSFDAGGVTLEVTASATDVTAYVAEVGPDGHARWALPLGLASPTRRDFNVHAVRAPDGDVIVAMPAWRGDGYDVRVDRIALPSLP